MPLTRANDRYLSDANDVQFLMQDGWLEVICRVDHKTLSRFGRSVGVADSLDVFKTFREVIECAASTKYDRTRRRRYEVVTITHADLRANDRLQK
jgi:hypothetical protein